MSEPELPQELNALADSLRALQPRCALPNRDRLMYEAGRRSARNVNRVWPVTSGVLAAALLVSLWMRPVNGSLTAVVTNNILTESGGPNYFHTRNAVLRDGLDALPRTAPIAAPDRSITTPLSSRLEDEV